MKFWALFGYYSCVTQGLRVPASLLASTLLSHCEFSSGSSASTIRDLIQRHRDNGGLITIPTHGGKGGHPILLDPVLLPELKSINEETLGVKAVVRAHENQTHRTEIATAEVLWDLNTPEEYAAALRSGS